jgi:hypothetical protein
MHREDRAALGASPFLRFVLDEMADADLLDAHQVVDGAGGIGGAVAQIQVDKAGTREGVTGEAILKAPLEQLLTVLHPAGDTALRFMRIRAATTRAGVLLPAIGHAEAAIDPAWGNQFWRD